MKAAFAARLDPLESFAEHRDTWDRLARESLDPNPFYAPDFVLACAQNLDRPGSIRILSIWEDQRLMGVLPLRRPAWREGLPRSVISAWTNPYVCLTSPLLAADRPACVFRAMLARLDQEGRFKALSLPILPVQRQTGRLIEHIMAEQNRRELTISHYPRALLAPLPGMTFREYVEQESADARKDFRRRESRLMAFGPVEHTIFAEPGAARARALEQFLVLEASGWKGRHRTALVSRPSTARFIQQAFRQDSGLNYEIERLVVDGIPLAMSLNLVSGGVIHTFKQAYDETWRPYAPGKLLDRRAIQRAISGTTPMTFDSCALPGYPIDAIWHERLVIAHRLIGLGASAKGLGLDDIALRAARIQKVMRTLKRWRSTLMGAKAPKAPATPT